MKILGVTLALLLFAPCLWGQHYLTLGVGFSTMLYGSDDLERFRDTYNQVNGPNLRTQMKGFGTGEGIRWELGYRYLGRLSMAVLAGVQNYTGSDAAHFQNGEVRDLELEINSLYLEYELGYLRKKFFVNGVVTVWMNRKPTVKSEYQTQASGTRNPLTGTYKTPASLATDLGVAVGVLREPVFLVVKVTYPVFTGGGSKILEDRAADKIADGLSLFPDDYVRYVDRQAYKGVASDINGLKVMVVVSLAIPVFSS